MSTSGRADSTSQSQPLHHFSPIRTISISPIQLVDHTKPVSEDDHRDEIEPESENEAQENEISDSPLSPKITRVSLHLRGEINRLKWARYQQERVDPSLHRRKRSQATTSSELEEPPASPGPESSPHPSADKDNHDEEEEGSGTRGESAFSRRRRYAQERAHDLLHRHHDGHEPSHSASPRPPHVDNKDKDSAIDILYENQRGIFLFGLPFFSSRSLLQFDSPAWVDAHFKPSATDIRNAEVPDPSWTWAWRTWYVDMSRDVDEEGWEYSFWFQRRTVWHGNHPWYGSFVRRRRWLRKRVRSHRQAATAEKAHAMAPDYFTIHTKGVMAVSPGSESVEAMSPGHRSSVPPTSAAWGAKDWHTELQEEFAEIKDIPTLMKALRKATIDREKIVYVTQFLDQCGDELYYLADQMPEIMELFVFQNSGRQLLSILMHRFKDASEHREEHKERGEKEDEEEQKYIDNLLKAIDAADEACKRLEYWSDMRDIVKKGETLHPTDHRKEWGHEWQEVDTSEPGTSFEGESGNGRRVDKGKGKSKETSNGDESVPPGQVLRRKSMDDVWPNSGDRERLEEEKDDSPSGEKEINEEKFKTPPERPTLSPLKIGNWSSDNEEKGVTKKDKLRKKDTS